MRCERVEERLNRLLDDRQDWSNDSSLVEHCAYCDSCRALAQAYSIVTLASAGSKVVPPLSATFSARVLAEITVREASPRQPVQFSQFQRYVVAAVLAIAVIPASLIFRVSPQPSDTAQIAFQPAATQPNRWNLTEFLDDEARLSDEVWVSTGREIAKLPHQVRRAAVFSESTPLTDAIRPVAVAWQTLWRVIPGEAVPSNPPPGETSLLVADPELSLA